MPAGHPQYLNRWELNHHATVNLSTLKVLVNGNPVSQGYHLDNGDLVFDQTPAPGTKIDVTYELGTLRDNVRETPIILKNFKVIQQVKVKLNDQEASEQDYSISRAANQTPMLNLAPHVFDDTDPFGIRARGGLDIFINYQFR